MVNRKKRVILTIGMCLALIALILGVFVAQQIHKQQEKKRDQFQGTLLKKGRPVSPFSLTRTDNKVFSNKSLEDQWTFVFFGFTQCGYICPTTMAELGKMYRLLQNDKRVTLMPQVVMITVDPKRDDLDKLRHYVQAFDSHFYGARAPKPVIDKLAKEMGIAYQKIASQQSDSSYDIEHTGTILLFNPQGQLQAFFTSPHDATQLANDFLLLTS